MSDKMEVDGSNPMEPGNIARLQGGDLAKLLKGFQDEEWELGIDEAGRGPVLGPMTYGSCFVPSSKNAELKALGFDDSKKLSEETRERMFRDIKACDFLGWNVIVLSAKEISGGMLQRSPYNLNAISHDTAEALIRQALADGINLKRVFVDTVGDPERYEAKLSAKFPQIQMTVRKKADSLFPIVSAASICAKVTRDIVVKQWKYSEADVQFTGVTGSGYPADEVTKTWLSKNCDPVFGFPDNTRFSWQTTKKILEESAMSFEWEADLEEDENQSKMGAYFVSNDKVKSKGTLGSSATFFAQRQLLTATAL